MNGEVGYRDQPRIAVLRISGTAGYIRMTSSDKFAEDFRIVNTILE